jgi:hypothetical protein
LWAIFGALMLVLLTAAPVRAVDNGAAGDPPGNNGTVKIDGVPFDSAPDNEPHPGCVFQVDFYGFDAGDLSASVTFEAVAPTAGGELLTDEVPIGEDSHAGGGSERGLDASRTYDLSSALAGITPQPNQGWHVRLTVHADGSQGSDVKHKVFWVDGCSGGAVAPSGVVPAANVTEGTVGSAAVSGAPDVPEAPAVGPPASVMATELAASPTAPALPVTRAVKPAEVLAESITRGPAPAGPSFLARTGIGLGLAVLALSLIAGGVRLVRMGRLVTRPRVA